MDAIQFPVYLFGHKSRSDNELLSQAAEGVLLLMRPPIQYHEATGSLFHAALASIISKLRQV